MREFQSQYLGPERQLPQASETEPRVLAAWIQRTSEAAKSYKGASEEEYAAAFELFNSYEQYLKQHFVGSLTGKKFNNAAEADEYLRSLVDEELSAYPKFFLQTQNLPRVGQEMLEAMIQSLREKAKSAESLEELCDSFGIVYQNMPEVLVPTFGKRPQTGSGAGFERGAYKDKLGELMPYLIESKLFGEHILVTEGVVRNDQMRDYPYVLIEIPELKKQILICNQLGEAVFVSQKWMGREIFAQADKEELQKEHGLDRVVYDRGGKWLEQVKDLLLENIEGKPEAKNADFSEALKDRPKVDVRKFALARAEVLNKFPTDMDFARRFLSRRYDPVFLEPKIKEDFGLTIHVFIKSLALGRPDSGRHKIHSGYATSNDFFRACLSVYPDSGQLKYMMDLQDSEQVKKMVKGDYPLLGIKGVRMHRESAGTESDLFNLEPQAFPTFERFWEDFLAKHKHHTVLISQALIKTYGFGLTYFVTMLTGTPKSRVPTMPEVWQALANLYPNDRQLKYFMEGRDMDKMIMMIKGEYDLAGLKDYAARKGVRKLQPKPSPTFDDFCKNFHIQNSAEIGEKLNASFGFGARVFVSKMGAAVHRNTSREDLLQALKTVYPESIKEIQAMIDKPQ